MTDETVYNTYPEFPDLSYNITKKLMTDNELIWKLLKYTDNDAWKDDTDHPNLTMAEKGALINDGSPDDDHSKFRIYFDVGQDSSWDVQACFLRIVPTDLYPANHIVGNVVVAFETVCHNQINALSNYTTRLNLVTQQLLETFNGKEIGGLGRLYFDARASNRCKMMIDGQIPFKENVLIMCNWI
jgi:hypothetical protein